MLFDDDIKADKLPLKTICLTYDDGPGPDSRELGEYLFQEGISATFFVVGRHAEDRLDVLADLKRWGHLVGNHTYSHAGLVDLAKAGGDVFQEVLKADGVLRQYVGDDMLFLRPPYGSWREKGRPRGADDRPASIVAKHLNRGKRLGHYVGPIKWEIVAEDWECWRRSILPRECARRYFDEVERVGRGIVLMHDYGDEELLRERNRTCELTKILVPMLKQSGYKFVRMDSIPQVQSALAVTQQVTFHASDNRFVARLPASDNIVVISQADAVQEVFGLVPAEDRFALRAGNGQYVTVGKLHELCAKAPRMGEQELFQMQTLGEKTICLRTGHGQYVCHGRSDGEVLRSHTAASRENSTFEARAVFS